MYKKPIRLFVLFAVALLLTTCTHAQENATLTGTVFDPTGAAQWRRRPSVSQTVRKMRCQTQEGLRTGLIRIDLSQGTPDCPSKWNLLANQSPPRSSGPSAPVFMAGLIFSKVRVNSTNLR